MLFTYSKTHSSNKTGALIHYFPQNGETTRFIRRASDESHRRPLRRLSGNSLRTAARINWDAIHISAHSRAFLLRLTAEQTPGEVRPDGFGATRGARSGQSPPTWETDVVSDPIPSYLSRIVTDGTDRMAWMRARARGITATDVAKLSTPRSIQAAAHEKLHGSRFTGNAYTEHGKAREPEIAAWVMQEHEIAPSQALFHAECDLRHLATPDGLAMRPSGTIELAEIKTTNKEWRSIPRNYLRQVWWQQYVLGAERTLMVWERHENFVPVGEPRYRWVDRDENEIERLVKLASELIDVLITRTS